MSKLLILMLLSLILADNAQSATLSLKDDPRYCGVVNRDAKGDIKRNMYLLVKFQKIHPCPSTGLTTGPCPGWSIDHVLSLACGGCDAIINMQWLPDVIKHCKGGQCKDSWERNIQYVDTMIPGLNPKTCFSKLIAFPQPQ